MARGITSGVFAYFVYQAIQSQNLNQVQGLNGTLEWIRSLSSGSILLDINVFDLAAYSVFQYFLARYS